MMTKTVHISIFALTCLSGVLIGAVTVGYKADLERQPDITALTDELARLREMVEADGRRVDDAAEEDDDDDLDFEQMVARDRDIAERRAAAITSVADREAVDPDWGPAVETQIAEGFAAHGPSGATLISSVCKTTLCIAEIERRSEADGREPRVNWLDVFGLSRGFFVRHELESGEGTRTMAYLARDGYPLPLAAERSVSSENDLAGK